DYLLDWSRAFPIFVLAMARPDLLERRPTWGAGRRNFTALTLEPLAEPAMGALLKGLVPGLPAPLTARILRRAEGVPLYAVETVRMLLDRGLLVPDGSAYRVAGPIDELEVPETLHALIASRLDGLALAERRLLQDAAVLGKSFAREALAALTGLDPADLESPLAGLVRKEVLGIQGDPRSPERGQYSFLQDLVRTVAYETLPRRDRKQRHLAAATYLESAGRAESDELAEVVANHYLEAAGVVPDAADAAEIRERARSLLVRAGERAASLAAAVEAQRAFEQALELTSDRRARAELRERAGQMAWLQDRAEAATAHFEHAIQDFQAEGAAHAAARVSAALADVLLADGRIEEGIRRMEAALAVLAGGEPDADVAVVAAQLARMHALTGDRARALELAEEALAIAGPLQLPAVLAEALDTKGVTLATRARVEEGEGLMRHALTLALAHEQQAAALRATNNLAWILEYRDRIAEALEVLVQGVELARRVGNRPYEWQLLGAQAAHLQLLGRWDEALALGAAPGATADRSPSQATVEASGAVVWIRAHRG
ncbi:MAG: ATP-binding protein, partial [Candidatus Dormibacteraceae bacterium]